MAEIPDLDRALRYMDVDKGCGFQVPAWDYAHRLRGTDFEQMRADWEAICRLLTRAREAREKRNG